MEKSVKLMIELPGKTLVTAEADSVIIPAKKGDITILSERAPSVFVTDFGMARLLDGAAKTTEQYFVAAGVADAAQATVHLMTPMAIDAKEITVEAARQQVAEAKNEREKIFYQMIVDKLENKNLKYIS